MDDWGDDLTAEDLDFLERDAYEKIALLKSSSSSSVTSTSLTSTSTPTICPDQQHYGSNDKVDLPHLDSRTLPTSSSGQTTDISNSKELPKLSVKFQLHSSGNIAAKFLYDPKIIGVVRNIPKAFWNKKERIWIFPITSLASAEKALLEATGSNVELENLDPLVRRAITSASSIPDLQNRYEKMPSSIETRLLPFQRDGVRFVLQHGGRALLADEMGLGKTLQAIAVAACVCDAWPVLVLTPSSLRLHWASMIQEWLNIPSSDILVVLSQSGGSNRGGFTIVPSNTKDTTRLDGLFNIISYDIVPKLQKVLMAADFKVVIADESHFLKNAQAKRTTACVPVIQKAQYAVLLSGTPALSRPIELFKQLEALYPDVYKSVHEYGNRYCKGGIFGLYQGASNHEELHNLMKSTVMIRRLKNNVLSELPVKRRQQFSNSSTTHDQHMIKIKSVRDQVFLDMDEKDMRPINALFRELQVLTSKMKIAKSKEEADSLKLMEKNLINKIYNDSGEAKIPAVLDYLDTVVQAGCKFLIFAHHQPMINAIHQFLIKKKVGCIRIDGGTPSASRQALVTDFQENDTIKAAVLSIRAGGVGLTLTAASTVFFAELSWTPGDLIQAEDRVHRIGQVSSVNIYYLLANDTIDDLIWGTVQSKLENLGQMLDGHENTLQVSEKIQPKSSPAKQKTLDSYLTRCSNPNSSEDQPKLKHSRH